MTLREAATRLRELHIDQVTNDRPANNAEYTRLSLEWAGRIAHAYLVELKERKDSES